MLKQSVGILLASMIGISSIPAQARDLYIAISFDGSKADNWWDDTRLLARNANAKVTYFSNGVYFLNSGNKTLYTNPTKGNAKSAIGWGGTNADITQRIENLLLMDADGHELGSHANGHFPSTGNTWSEKQWRSEFNQFHDFMFNMVSINGLADRTLDSKVKALMKKSFYGFRAPQLETSEGLWPVMRNDLTINKENIGRRYLYDASAIASQETWPYKKNGVWKFPLAQLRIKGTKNSEGKERATLSMDYNFLCSQSELYRHDASRSSERAACSEQEDANYKYNSDAGNSAWAQKLEKQMYDTYMRWFQSNYNGGRVPMNIGHHFANWNGNAYYRALARFSKEVCTLPDVKCVTYKELVQYMENDAPAQYRSVAFGDQLENQIAPEFEGYSADELKYLMGDLPGAHFQDAASE